jgi:DtxR family Mn-dependent transcriptional regulator
MKKSLTNSIQHYLKHIYELTENGGAASTNTLASCLNVKPASVTGMVQKLASSKPALVEYQKHQGVTLTPQGKKAALEVIRHHRLLETWLVQTLGYTWDEVHEEAERLEHVISEDFEARIARTLGNPIRDPHGEPIPTSSLTMPADTDIPLSALRPTQRAVIRRVRADDLALLRHVKELGLVPGAEIQTVAYSPFDQNTSLQVGRSEETVILGAAITSRIFVEII